MASLTIYENANILFTELIDIRYKQISIMRQLTNIDITNYNYNLTKDITALEFKLKNYKIWITTLKTLQSNNIQITNRSDIDKLDLTSKLKINLYEIFDSNKLNDITIALKQLQTLETQMIEISSKTIASSKVSNTNTIDTSLIEAQPKILNTEERPNDDRGGAIFDLRYIHGIGKQTSIKLYDKGLTLQGLLTEWDDWSSKSPSNKILTPYLMERPKEYTQKQWIAITEIERNKIQELKLIKKLQNETKYLSKLHKASLVGIKYFKDMSQKIHREEIQRAEAILKGISLSFNKDLILTLCGSFRRGATKSGDIDCLISHPSLKTIEELTMYNSNTVSNDNIFQNFVKILIDAKFIIDLLEMGNIKIMSFCNVINSDSQVKPIARRLDIRVVPYNSYGSAILYFTGSKLFNTQMRTLALRKGYSLNEYGLIRLSDKHLFTCATEEIVFKMLNYPYKTPAERNIS